MKVKLIITLIILLLVMVFAGGCSQFMENIGLINPTDEEQLSPEKASPDGLVKVLIGFKEKPGADQQAMVRVAGGQIKYTYHIVDAIAASIPEKAIEALQKNPNVRYVEPDGQVFALETELESSWGVERIGAGIVHADGNKGDGVKVAIIDSGIDYSHADLDDNYAGGWDFVNNDAYPMDDNGHGTHVAGIVAAEDNYGGVVGVAPEAKLYALKVLDSGGSGDFSDVIAALEWCMEEGIQVTNNSYGSSGEPDQTLRDAFNMAYYDFKIIHVAAAGNSGNPPGIGDNVGYPAAYDSVIAVAATDQNDVRARWSSTGPDVELAAPGVSVTSTWLGDGYASKSGTSMASPHVAGVAALVIKAGTSSDVRTQLQTTADDLGDPGEDDMYGYGLVNAVKAVGMTSADNLGPVTSNVVAEPNPTNGATFVTLTADVSDATTGNSDIATAEYFVDTVGNDGSGTPMDVSDGTFDFPTEEVTASINVSTADWVAGNQYTLYVHGRDEAGYWGDTKSVVLEVTEESSNIMYVESVTFSAKKAGKNLFLYTTVDVSLKDNGAVDGARVTMTLTDGTSFWNFSSDTGSDGAVKFTLKAQAGNYTATVTEVSHPDYAWDEDIMTKNCQLYEDGTVVQQ